jgi:predicted metal-binding protein
MDNIENYKDALRAVQKKEIEQRKTIKKLLQDREELKKQLALYSVVVPNGTLCNCNSTTTDEFRNGVNWRTCNNCGISRIA